MISCLKVSETQGKTVRLRRQGQKEAWTETAGLARPRRSTAPWASLQSGKRKSDHLCYFVIGMELKTNRPEQSGRCARLKVWSRRKASKAEKAMEKNDSKQTVLRRNDRFLATEYRKVLFPIMFSVLGGTINALIDSVFVSRRRAAGDNYISRSSRIVPASVPSAKQRDAWTLNFPVIPSGVDTSRARSNIRPGTRTASAPSSANSGASGDSS